MIASPTKTRTNTNAIKTAPNNDNLNKTKMTTAAATSAAPSTAATATKPINPTAPPADMITPSHIAKAKWNDVIENISNEELAAITRTYTNRLHQLRLQREKHQGTHERHTKVGSTMPGSCLIHFQLGASPAIKERPDYKQLKESVESTIEATQNHLKNSIVQLQVLELQVKEEEIRKMFCEGLAKIAVALINVHRDDEHARLKIAKTMQSMRLADRLVELLMEQHGEMLECSFLVENDHKDPIPQYYKQVGRDVPTHSRQQNRNAKSSPYNPHHTRFLEEILEEYKNIVEPCFHSSWKEYLSARSKLHRQQSQEKSTEAYKRNSIKITESPTKRNSLIGKNNKSDTDALRALVQNAVSEQTRALRSSIRSLEVQLQEATHAGAVPIAENGANTKPAPKKKSNHQKKNGAKEDGPRSFASVVGTNSKANGAKPAAAVNKNNNSNNGNNKKNHQQNNGANKKQEDKMEDNSTNTERRGSINGSKRGGRGKGRGKHKDNTENPSAAKAEATNKPKDTTEPEPPVEEESENGASSSGPNKKKRNRKRNKGKGANGEAVKKPENGANQDTNAAPAASTEPKPDNGATKPEATKPENGKTPEVTVTENNKPDEEKTNGNTNTTPNVETPTRDSITMSGRDSINMSASGASGRRTSTSSHVAGMDDSTTEMFGSYASGGRKVWG